MTTAIDSNILLDIITPDSHRSAPALTALETLASQGPLVISEAVYAEIAVGLSSVREVDDFLDASGIYLVSSSQQALHRAGQSWVQYLRRRPAGLVCTQCNAVAASNCAQCGATLTIRQHLVADFMIGAHALYHADGLLTRDQGVYRTYFPDLRLA